MTDWFAPAYEVRLGGTPLPPTVATRVTELVVESEPSTFDHFRLTLANPFPELPFTQGREVGRFAPGAAVEIRLGYVNRVRKVFSGEITSITSIFPESGLAAVVVEGYTRLHRLRGTTKTRSFSKVTDAEIADRILSELDGERLTLRAGTTTENHPYILQCAQTDLDFLLGRAQRIGFNVWVDDKTLYFDEARPDPGPAYTLVWGHPSRGVAPDGRHLPLRSFAPTLNTMQPLSSVTVQGSDPRGGGEIFTATAPEGGSAGRGRSGADVAAGAGRRVEAIVVNEPVYSNEEARHLARSIYEGRLREFVSGNGTSIGLPELRAGGTVVLEGLGSTFSGEYYVARVTHTVSTGGYTTTFVAKKGRVEEEAA